MLLRVRPPGNAATWPARAVGSAALRKRSCAGTCDGADAPQVLGRSLPPALYHYTSFEDSRFSALETRFSNLETRFDARFNNLEVKFDTLIGKIVELDNRVTRIEAKLDIR
jgi:hypothetical protein